MYEIGDKVNIRDRSYGFGIENNRYTSSIPMKNLTIIETGLQVMGNADGQVKSGSFCEVCDLLVKNDVGYYFIPSQDCKLINKEIIIRYFSDGKDVTDQISDETKRNLKVL